MTATARKRTSSKLTLQLSYDRLLEPKRLMPSRAERRTLSPTLRHRHRWNPLAGGLIEQP